MRSIRMPTELQLLGRSQLERLLKPLPNPHQGLPPRVIAALPLPHRPRPQPDPEERLAHIDHHAHDLVVSIVLERLADGSELRVKPQFVDVDGALVFELVGPLAAVLVLRVFPFGPDGFFEEVVVGF
jgi:hypothetical protein